MLLAALVACVAQLSWGQGAQVQWNGIERVVAFGDVHGAYTELHTLLRETGIIDAGDHWAAGQTHLVSLGDLLDRGADSRKVMDLLMRLQDEARAAGGQVHVLLGNHEAMNLMGDLRYVEAGEFAAYAELEKPTDRIDPTASPGFYGQRAAFAAKGRYGAWLLAQPVAIKINETLFMHGGPAPEMQGIGLAELNLRYRTALADYLQLVTSLVQSKLLQAADDFDARPRLARERLVAAGSGAAPGLADTVQRFEKTSGNWLLSEAGPNWYRGAAMCNEAAEADVLLPLLSQFSATRLVVGHTPTRDLRAVTRFDGQLVKLDTGMNRAAYKGRAAALFIRPSGLAVRYAGQPDEAALSPEPLFVAPNELDDASVLAALREGEVSVTGPRAPNELQVTVSHNGRRIPAVFQVRTAVNARKEVAAFRLDRLLGLGMIPATFEREVQGQRGVLQARPLKWVTQAQVQQQSLRVGGWCAIEPQFQLLYALDVLSGNEGRSAESLLYDPDDGLVYGTSHERAFGTTRSLPAYLKARPPAPGVELRRRIATLDEPRLRSALAELVDAEQVRAILIRRDLLLALPATSAGADQR